MRKEIWFFHRLGLIEIVIAAIAISGITTIGGIWVTTAAKSVYINPMDNLPYTVLVLALYLLFNGLLIGLCCAAALCILKFLYVALNAIYRLLRTLLAQPIHLAHLIIAGFAALIGKSRAIRRRRSR
ncbi:hypothetical protein [Rhizobium rhizogenes]|uniref:hypothetical protein n=1 Tax=Rhizobium rhizogenes TaxID=359 RepID=UPI0015734C21|nr:hypothetical protein [Rhizobium rhizogenes]NTH68496.1 hypothetical protein [Rhizobium rhizogenes]NTI39124.1 hypothetical protein [Rhizobium rhizogenes]WEO70163.1 hypothetical protein G6L54_034575 [Rhizobium rhizogenes]